MKFTIDGSDDKKHIALFGNFTFADNQQFKEMMAELDHDPVKAVTLDFAGVEFIDSGALGMLLLFRDRCQSRHINLSLHSAHGQVKKTFLIARFDQLFAMRGAK